MAMRDRIHKITDRELTWTGAIILGTLVWVLAIILLGQIPSVIIYKADQYIAEIIEFTAKIPGVNEAGLNTKQVKIIRDMVANGVQINFLIMMLAGAYIYQERKRKRTGAKGLPDPVRGYMPGK
jgi:Na+/H+ antiporter NhaC